MRSTGLAGFLLLTSCATALVDLPPPAAAPKLDAWRDKVDWKAVRDETAALLSAYLQVDTTNPPGNETRGTDYLKAILDREGIRSQTFEFAPGRGSLVARLKGTSNEPG